MAKESSRTKSRAVKRLQPYNRSPSGRPRDARDAGAERGDSSRDSVRRHSRSRSHSHSPSGPPEWAKELLKQQQENAAELKRLQGELSSAKSQKNQQPHAADPEFRFAGNKKQYFLNRDVMDKIDEALEADDNEERTRKLTEGKELLVERNKHILLAEKYGWDTVACYTADPLASDSDDEKKIRKAIKESKQLREEKKRNSSAKVAKPKGVIPRSSDRRGILDRNSTSALSPFVAGKQNQSRDGRSVCFRCFKPGHFARDCRAANVFNGAGSAGQTSSNYQQPAQ